MKWKKWLENWDMTSLKIKAPFLEMEWLPSEPDKAAAWELYAELLTRVTTRALSTEEGDERAALQSIHSLFRTTREVMKSHGRECVEFTKIAIVVLNQKVRPFTSKWHRISLSERFDESAVRAEFRDDLNELQAELKRYTGMLADMAGVEDLSDLEG